MCICTKQHNNLVNGIQDISLKAKNVDLLMELQLKLQDNNRIHPLGTVDFEICQQIRENFDLLVARDRR